MIFQHTLDKVLSGEKTQTSRIWKPSDYQVTAWRDSGNGLQIRDVSSIRENALGNTRKLYYLGQILSVQPSRGVKAVAKIRILELAKRDVRNFTDKDMQREGFEGISEFLRTWAFMHDKWLFSKIQHFSQPTNLTGAITDNRPSELYTALVIRFELVKD